MCLTFNNGNCTNNLSIVITLFMCTIERGNQVSLDVFMYLQTHLKKLEYNINGK